jgi:hypothetical protein
MMSHVCYDNVDLMTIGFSVNVDRLTDVDGDARPRQRQGEGIPRPCKYLGAVDGNANRYDGNVGPLGGYHGSGLGLTGRTPWTVGRNQHGPRPCVVHHGLQRLCAAARRRAANDVEAPVTKERCKKVAVLARTC